MYNLIKDFILDWGENLAIGDKIKKIRIKRGFTQKELGLAIGFSDRTADVRIAQYESGTRVPKEKIVFAIAQTLKVNPNYLMAPALSNSQEIIHTLFYLDEYNSIDMEAEEIIKENGESGNRIKLHLMGLDHLLEEWYEKKKALESGRISQEEYYEWKLNWPEDMNKS